MVVFRNKYIMMNTILFVPLILFLLKVFLFVALVLEVLEFQVSKS